MIRNATRALVVAVMATLVSAPAAGQSPAPAHRNAHDPNEVICEKQEVTGSRLATRRVCKTRAEWADLRLQDRQETERIQTQRGMKGE